MAWHTPVSRHFIGVYRPLQVSRLPRRIREKQAAVSFETWWVAGPTPRHVPMQGLGGVTPIDPAGLFSEGGGVIKFHIEGSLTIPTMYI